MEVGIPTRSSIGESLFMCSEQHDLCYHACRGHKHKIFWNNADLLKNEADVEEEVPMDEEDRREYLLSWRQRALTNVVEGLFTASDEAWEDALAQALISHGVDLNALQREESQEESDEGEQMEVGGASLNAEDDALIDQVAANISTAITSYFRAMGRADARRYLENARQSRDSDDESSGDDMFPEPPSVTRTTFPLTESIPDVVESDSRAGPRTRSWDALVEEQEKSLSNLPHKPSES